MANIDNTGISTQTSKGLTIQSLVAWLMLLALLELFSDTGAAEVAVAMAWLITFVVILTYGQGTFTSLQNTFLA